MRVVDPGHWYHLDDLDRVDGWAESSSELRFVKRTGDAYPGNVGTGYNGTTSQEVLRVLIDRTKYVDKQQHDQANSHAIGLMRGALQAFEDRAARKRDEWDHYAKIRSEAEVSGVEIEDMPTCDTCGHIGCRRHTEVKGHP